MPPIPVPRAAAIASPNQEGGHDSSFFPVGMFTWGLTICCISSSLRIVRPGVRKTKMQDPGVGGRHECA